MTQQTRSNFISTVASTLTDGGANTAAEVRTILGNDIDSCLVILTDTSDVITEGSTNLFLTSAERTKLSNTSGTNTGDQTTITGNAGTATALQTARTIGGVSFDGTANIVPQTIQMVNDAADTTCFIMFGNASGTVSQQPKTNTTLTFNASTGILAATGFSGPLTGNASTATALATSRNIGGVAFNGTADIVPTTIVVADTTSATCFVGLWEAATGSLLPKSDAGLTYNASTGILTSTGFSGPLTGNVTGNVSGSSGSTTGNAATATVLQTGRTINGVLFNGSANIDVPVLAADIVTIRQIPQNSQSAAYTLVLTDAGKHILHPSADTTARTFTIPANGSVAFPIGTAITFVNQNAAGVITIAITTDTMRLAGAGTTGSRTLAANGIATALKITSTEWIISGVGLT